MVQRSALCRSRRELSNEYFHAKFGSAAVARSLSPFFFWRSTARAVECRWRQRSKKLRATATEPQHPGDEQDDAVIGEVDTIAEGRSWAPFFPFHRFIFGSRAQQNSAKEPRNDRALVIDSGAKSKRLNKPSKENEKGIEFKTDIEHYLFLYLVL